MSSIIKHSLNTVYKTLLGVEAPPGFFAAILTLALFLMIGTFFYATVEGWSYLDAFYFSGITLTTVGFGDLHPTQPLSKLFTVFYIFAGVGIGVFIISSFSQSLIEGRKHRLSRLEKLVKDITGDSPKAE